MLRLAGAVAGAILLAATASAQDGTALPGGATSLAESHGDWVVGCDVVEGRKQCTVSQSVGNGETGQQLMTVQLGAPVQGQAEGMLLTAFGLKLADGISFGVDGAPLLAKLPFLTCMPSGCFVPLTFDAIAVSALRLGKVLEASGTSVQGGQAVTVPISLTGFTAAYDRMVELSQ